LTISRWLAKSDVGNYSYPIQGRFERQRRHGQRRQVARHGLHPLQPARRHPQRASQTAPAALSFTTAVKLEYWHKDPLGSLIATTDHLGGVTERYAYDPFGKRRYTNSTHDAFGALVIDWTTSTNKWGDRGFTGHEHLDDLGLIHMNGRIYDPTIGRFMQADPRISRPFNLQDFDRYSYCFNNPVTCTDPSGEEEEGESDTGMTDAGTQSIEVTGLRDGSGNAGGGEGGMPSQAQPLTTPFTTVSGKNITHGLVTISETASEITITIGLYSSQTTSPSNLGFAGSSFAQGSGGSAAVGVRSPSALVRASATLAQWRQEAGPSLEPAGGFQTPNELVELWAAATNEEFEVRTGRPSIAAAMATFLGLKTGPRGGIPGRGGARGGNGEGGGTGSLTPAEHAQIQAIANKFNTVIDVVGSRAAGLGRNVNTTLPRGRGPGTRSDIDFRIDSSHPNVDALINDLKGVGGGVGSASTRHSTTTRLTVPPLIRFTPD
jgi:RHS repeat-associated protein